MTAIGIQAAVAGMALRWIDICALDDLPYDAGVAARLEPGDGSSRQIALFRIEDSDELYAIANLDPFSRANVLGRGILCRIGGEPAVASPVFKQHFRLRDGRCVEDDSVTVEVFPVRVIGGRVEVAVAEGAG
ncbi:MAG: nitrite reductase small subunit NirD [Pseudomonadota bacterium]|jgi:NAD(P)H-dependent nitrite reductase small subunit